MRPSLIHLAATAITTLGVVAAPATPASAHGSCAGVGQALYGWFGPDSFYVTGGIECDTNHQHFDVRLCLQVSTLPDPLSSYTNVQCNNSTYDSTGKTAHYVSFTWQGGCGSTLRHWRAYVSGHAGAHYHEFASPGSFQIC